MFVHSQKVPQLYKLSSKYLKEIIENGSSLKDLIYNQSKFSNVKALYALLSKTLQHYSEINHMIDNSELLTKEPRFNPWLARVLITQLFWSNNGLVGNCKPITTILSYRAALENHRLNSGDQKTVSKVIKPRYVRVNTLAISLEETINGFCKEGWELVEFKGNTYNDFISTVASLGNDQFMIDVHVENLLIFPAKTMFYNHEAYKLKSIVLQDKASCLPVHFLNPTPGSSVLDCCAAPGMKTTFLAAWLNNEGTVYAVEHNLRRYEILNKLIDGTYATCIKPINSDVLLITPEQCPNVEYILVDPSCSGSGITDRVALDDEPENVDAKRLKKLSNFQAMILKHSLQNFPQAKRVVYSTCSVHVEENENVVDEVLRGNTDFKLVKADKLLSFPFNKPKLLGDHLDYVRSCCIRTAPKEDLTNGFFIAIFERIKNEKKSKEQQEEVQLDHQDEEYANRKKKNKRMEETIEVPLHDSKVKKKKVSNNIEELPDADDEVSQNIRKKKKKSSSEDDNIETDSLALDKSEKKKKQKATVTEDHQLIVNDKDTDESVPSKKKKKHHGESEDGTQKIYS